MKSNNFLILFLIIYTFNFCHAQTGTPPTTGYPTNPNQAVTNANFAWYRGGNNPGGPAANNNILGTRWASDIWIMTNNNTIAQFSTGFTLGPGIIPSANQGDGSRILPRTLGM